MKRKIVAKYSNEQLLKAIQAVKNGLTQFAAAKTYGVPRSTLHNKISGKSKIGKKSGPGTVLSYKEEKCIENWLICLAERGFPVVKRQLLRSIQLYLNANKRNTPFSNNYPGRKWYANFLKRHPIIAKRLAQNLIKSRAAVTENQLKAWHAEVHKYCEEHNLLDALNDPMRVFNMDEKGFILTPKNEVVLAKRGQRAVYNRSQNDEKECVTALLGGNAAGTQTPPMLVYAYKRMPSNILLNLPADWSVGISDNGWQTQHTFMDYVSNVFCKWLTESNIKLPVILFIDGHKSHISLTLSEFCSAHQIELVALYPNATHIIQPMDVVVFKPLGAAWEIKLKDWKISHEFAKIDKKDIAPILSESMKAIDYAGLLQTGFKRCGLFPFDVANMNFSRLLPPTNDISQDQVFNDDDSTEPKPIESKQGVLDKLKIFEELIEPTVLNMFRSSEGDWTGPIEYTALYTLWCKLYTDTTAFISMEDEEAIMIIDVETSNSEISPPPKERQSNAEVFIVGENGQLLNSDGTQVIVFGDNEVVVDDMVDNITDTTVPSDATVPPDAIIPLDTIVPLIEECDSTVILNSTIACDRPMKLNMERTSDRKPLEMDKSGQGHSRMPMSDDPKEMSIDNNRNVIEMDIEEEPLLHVDNNTKADPTILTKKIQSKMADTQSFDEAAFKKSFVVPKPNESKKKKNVQKERVSTVITSEAWKESEQKKLREKQRLEAEKEARKIERERKKILAAELKIEKEIAKEKKKIEKAEKEAQKKKTRKGTKKNL